MNALPQFITRSMEWTFIAFVSVSKRENALSLIVTPEGPGSIIEQMRSSIR
jgi:hypothetical protein